jgi:catechol 2,3-dioxygenase-like lactoylglutathione lyase family enzyme
LTDALTHGVHHVGLAVRDLDEATSFFCGTLGFKEVGRNDAYPAVFVSDGGVTLTIWRVADPQNAVAFNRKTNIGLHHLALAVADEAALATVHERVRNHPGVVLEFNPEPVRAGSTTHHFICAIPGGIRIEFATRAG